MKELITAIQTLGETVSGLSSANFGHEKYFKPAAGTYCTYFIIDNPFGFDSGSELEKFHVQFKFYGTNFNNLADLIENFESMFDFTDELSVTGYTVINCIRIQTHPFRKHGRIWESDLEYFIFCEKAR